MTQRPSFRMIVGMVVGLVLGTLPMILPAIGLDSPPQSSTGTITTVAGNGVAADTGDGGPAAAASLAYPRSVATGRDGSIYIMVPGSVRKISSTGIISTIAGSHNLCSDSGHAGPAYGDGGPATAALFNCGVAVTVDGGGNLYVADNGNNRIRKIDTSGIITTVVGTGDPGYSGDGGPASAATLNDPSDVEFDSAGNMLIADFGNHRVRRVDGAGIISTIAGNGANGSSGDGGLATEAAFRSIQAIAPDNLGNIFVSDFGNGNVRRVDAAGVISTVASNVGVLGMEADANGNLFMANSGYSDVLRLDRTGTITTVAGTHSTSGFSGDGGPAIKALLVSPQDVAIDAAGNLLIADEQNHRLRKIENGVSSGTTTSSTTGSIAFVSRRTGTDQVYFMKPDGMVQTQITFGNTTGAPTWLGKTGGLAYVRGSGTHSTLGDLVVRSPDGHERVAYSGQAGFPSSSPDGKKIAFTSLTQSGPESQIVVISSDGTGLQQLTNSRCFNGEPAWSPDGSKIAFWSSRDSCGNYDLYVMNSDGSGQTRLTNAPSTNGAPSWSPDSHRIAFESTRDGNRQIYLMNADGSGVVRITNSDSSDGHPSWSPDGTRIAFESSRSGNLDIYSMKADGSDVRQITTNAGDDSFPSWGLPPAVTVSTTTTSSTSTTTTIVRPPTPIDGYGMRGGTLPANLPPPGLDTGMTVSRGDSVSITAVGSAGYGYEGEPCVGSPRTDPDGNRTINGASCGSPKFDASATVPSEPIGKLLYGVSCPAGMMWSPAGAHTTFTWNGCDNAALRLAYNDSIYGDNTDSYTWIATKTAPAAILPPPISSFLSAVLPAPIVSIIGSILPNLLPTTTTTATSTSTTSTTLAPPPPPPPVDRYGITSYDRMTGGAPHFGNFDYAYQAFTAQSNRVTFLGVTVGTPGYTPDGHTVRIRLCGDSACSQVLAEANPQITNYGNSFADIGDVAVNPGQQYYVVYYQPAAWHGQTWVTYWWAGGSSVSTSDQMQAVVKGFNSSQPPATPPPPPPPANNYVIQTDGRCANVRTGPDTSYQAVTCLANGTPIAIECQTRGGPAYTNNGQMSNVWDRLSSPNGGNYVSDILTNTPAFNDFSPGIRQCSGGPVVGPPIPPNPHDCESFVADVTVPDGTRVNKGATFTKTWRLLNCGNTDWHDLTAQRIGGNFGPSSFAVPVTAPGSTVDVSVTLTAPNTTGIARVTYALFGPRGRVPIQNGTPGYFYAEVNLVSSGKTVPPVVTPPPGVVPFSGRYIALGDSFSSGEGNPPFDGGTDIHEGSSKNLCHRSSLFAYPRLLAKFMAVDLTLKACSGARIGDFYNAQYSGQEGQRQYIDASVKLVTLTVGGDDMGFVDLIKGCFALNCLQQDQATTQRLAVIKQLLPALYRSIKNRAAKDVRIVVIGYPQIAPDPAVVATSHCAAVHLIGSSFIDDDELRFLRGKVVELNGAISAAVSQVPGVEFINPDADTASTFHGHELCTPSPWFNPIQAGDPFAFHPNICGQWAYAQLLATRLGGDIPPRPGC